MEPDLPVRGGIALPPPEPPTREELLARQAPLLKSACAILTPTPRERLTRAIPMLIFLSLLPVSACVTMGFEKAYRKLEMGTLPIITEHLLGIKNFIFDWPLFYVIISLCAIFCYVRWISKDAILCYVLNFVLILGLAFGSVFQVVGLLTPILFPESVCFLPGTSIETPEGPKPIETVKLGEKIYTRCADGKNEIGAVTACIKRSTQKWLTIQFENGSSLGVTPEHPFGVHGGGWRPAGELNLGDAVLTRSGETKVLSVQWQQSEVTVYNLTVEPHHTYFAGDILVHNRICR